MGWGSGSYLAEAVWNLIKKEIPKEKRKKIASKLIDLFEDEDCDTLQECEDLCQVAGRYQDEEE